MVISKAKQKAVLFLLFYDKTPLGLSQKQFPIAKLLVAASTAKKLTDGSKEQEGKTQFFDGEVTFTADEWVFLKELFATKTEATVDQAEAIEELKEIFK